MTSVTLTASTLRRDSNMFVSSYEPSNWTGSVTAYAVEAETGNVSKEPVWDSAKKMDAISNYHQIRKVFSHNGDDGIVFGWGNLSSIQKTLISNNNQTLGVERIDFIKGKKVTNYRQRNSIHGDIVNSKAWYHNGDAAYLSKTGKEKDLSKQTRKIVYVGANDGMLHAFNASNGVEAFAYIPQGLYAKLPELTKTDYVHQYYVDGSPFVSEVKIGADWKDYLVGTLGAGGKGYFILDVTNPASFSASDVKLDVTGTADADIGYIFGEPTADQASPTRATQLTQLNDGRWAFVTGNGYNSTNQNSVLLIQYLDGTLKKLTATPSSKAVGNGLSAPRLIDLSGDGIPDVAYAGDLSGNLWKFDLTCALDGSGKAKEGNACSNDYKVAFSGKPLFTAKDTLNQAQPITTAPAFIRHTSAPGLILTFGTGQNLTNDDRTTNYQQTLYGIHDRTGWTVSTSGTVSWTTPEKDDAERAYQTSEYPIKHTELQTMSLTRTTEENDDGERVAAWKVTGEVPYFNQSSGSSTFKKGWALNLPVNKSRVLGNIEWVSGELFRVRFMVPAEGGAGGTTDLIETCEAVYSEREDYVGLFNAISGKSYKSNSTDYFGFGEDPSQGLSVFLSTGDGGLKSVTPPGVEKGEDFAAPGMIGLKPNWRQVN
ncbi:type IV pilus assembly protein PilY1 [Lampropedia hyalina DSM 16112]|uniref:Type IV pilus assembly protein PilY1 n=2 Tax=Lampropedia TaxID=198705 RepID=A0A1M4YZ32_9BURK|nr:type IV pilus assembly protein PilY1 [Lampropedia hyalina DSM 16112]